MHVSGLVLLCGGLALFSPLGVSAAELSLDCPFDADGEPAYINDGTTEDCTCQLIDPGNAPGTVKWIHPWNHTLAEASGSATIELSYNPDWLYCDDDWTFYSGVSSCVKVFDVFLNWTFARLECQKHGGDLVKIEDEDFVFFLRDNLLTNYTNQIWIGMHDQNEEGLHQWLDETEPVKYTYWRYDQPSNWMNVQHCVTFSMNGADSYWWNDKQCPIPRNFICQKDALKDDNHDKTYICEGISADGTNLEVNYTTNFRVGPQSVRASVNETTFNMAVDTAPVSIQCEVDKKNSNPKPNVTIQGVLTNPIEPDSETDSALSWVFSFSLLPDAGGDFTAKCVAENDGVAKVEDEFSFIVQGPPRVELSGCPVEGDGTTPAFAKETDNVTCSCVMTAQGNPAGQAVWVVDGNDLVTGNPTASFTLSRSDHGTKHKCLGRNHNGDGVSVDYSPKVAYGPDAVTIGPSSATIFQLTDSSRVNGLSLTCDVNIDDFSPDISVQILMTPGGALSPNSNFEVVSSTIRRYHFTYQPTTDGVASAQCVATNSQFPDLTSSDTMTIHVFEFLDLSLHSDCPFDGNAPSFIKEGETKTCTCRVTNSGNPPAPVRWVDSSGTEVSTGVSEATLTLAYDANRQDHLFTCVPGSSIVQGTNKSYDAAFAFGPTSMDFAPVLFPAVKICPGASTSMVVDCHVPKTTVHPAPEFSITGLPSGITPTESDRSDENIYQKRFAFDLNTAGTLSITCKATNPITGTRNQFTRAGIVVAQPPPSAPVMKIDDGPSIVDGSVQTIQSGQTVAIKCDVDGGYPPVTSVTLSCGTTSVINDAIESVLSLIVTNDLNQQNCSCSARHDSDCYDQTTYFSVNVAGAAETQAVDAITGAAIGGGLGGGVVVCMALGGLVFFLKAKCFAPKVPTDFIDSPPRPTLPDNDRLWMSWRAFQNPVFGGPGAAAAGGGGGAGTFA